MEIAKSHTPSYIWIDSFIFSLSLSLSLGSARNPDPWIASERKSGCGPLLSAQGVLDASDRANPVATSPRQGIPGLQATSRACTYVCARARARVYTKGSGPKARRGMTVAEEPRDRARRETQLELNWSVLGRAFRREGRGRVRGRQDGERAEFS